MRDALDLLGTSWALEASRARTSRKTWPRQTTSSSATSRPCPQRAAAHQYHPAPDPRGKVYCCVVFDLFSGKVVGGPSTVGATTLVNDALSMAARTREPSEATVIHSDHGSQFTSWAFTENVRRLGLMGSMGTVGDCYDNAPMESFWGSMQIELLNGQALVTRVLSRRRRSPSGSSTSTTGSDATAPSATSRRTSSNSYTQLETQAAFS